MTGKMKIREIVFLFASIAVMIMPFLPVVRLASRISTHLSSSSFSLTDGYFGYVIVMLSALAIFLFGFKQKVKPAGIIQIVNVVICFVFMFFFIDYYRTTANSDDLMFWFVSWSETSYEVDYMILPTCYFDIGAGVLLIFASIACLIDKETY